MLTLPLQVVSYLTPRRRLQSGHESSRLLSSKPLCVRTAFCLFPSKFFWKSLLFCSLATCLATETVDGLYRLDFHHTGYARPTGRTRPVFDRHFHFECGRFFVRKNFCYHYSWFSPFLPPLVVASRAATSCRTVGKSNLAFTLLFFFVYYSSSSSSANGHT